MICLDLNNKSQFSEMKKRLEGSSIEKVYFDRSAGEISIDTPNGRITLTLFSGRFVEWSSNDELEIEKCE